MSRVELRSPQTIAGVRRTGDTANGARVAERYTEGIGVYTDLRAPVLRAAAQPLLARLPLAEAGTVIDVGCGPGALLPDLRAAAPDAVVVGVDRTLAALARARTAGRHRLAVMDATRPALRPASVDVIVACFVLFHLPDPSQGLRRLRDLLRPSGAIGVTVWGAARGCPATDLFDAELSAAGVDEAPDAPVFSDARMDSPAKLATLLRRSGFTAPVCWSAALDHRWDPLELLAFCCGFGERRRRLAALPEGARSDFVVRMLRSFADLSPAQLTERSAIVHGIAQRPSAPAPEKMRRTSLSTASAL